MTASARKDNGGIFGFPKCVGVRVGSVGVTTALRIPKNNI